MEHMPPNLGQDQILIVKAVEPSYVVVDVGGVLYRAHCMGDRNNPPGKPLHPEDSLIITNVDPKAMTAVERVTSEGVRDSCYVLSEYQAVSSL